MRLQMLRHRHDGLGSLDDAMLRAISLASTAQLDANGARLLDSLECGQHAQNAARNYGAGEGTLIGTSLPSIVTRIASRSALGRP